MFESARTVTAYLLYSAESSATIPSERESLPGIVKPGDAPERRKIRFLLSAATSISKALVSKLEALSSPTMAAALLNRLSSKVIVVLTHQ